MTEGAEVDRRLDALERHQEGYVTQRVLDLTLAPINDKLDSIAKLAWLVFGTLLTVGLTLIGTVVLK